MAAFRGFSAGKHVMQPVANPEVPCREHVSNAGPLCSAVKDSVQLIQPPHKGQSDIGRDRWEIFFAT